MQDKKLFNDMLTETKAECDKFKEYDQRKKEPEYNQAIANINNKLQQLSEEKVKINE